MLRSAGSPQEAGRMIGTDRNYKMPYLMKIKNNFLNFIYYFWLRWVFVDAHGLSLVEASGACSSLRCTGFSLLWLL